MREGKIRVKTLEKLLTLSQLARFQQRIPTIDQIVESLKCSRNHGYNYQRALKKLFPSMKK